MEKRREKYQRKMDYIIDKISDFPNDDYDEKYRMDIIAYRLHTSIQAMMDILAMLCKDYGMTVKDDYSNIEQLQKKQVFDNTIILKLKMLNGLRNSLVHRYNHIEEENLKKEKDEIISDLILIVKRVEEILNDNQKEK